MKKQDIEGMLKDLSHEIAIETLVGRTAEMIASFKQQFDLSGTLTERQQKVLRDVYRNHIG